MHNICSNLMMEDNMPVFLCSCVVLQPHCVLPRVCAGCMLVSSFPSPSSKNTHFLLQCTSFDDHYIWTFLSFNQEPKGIILAQLCKLFRQYIPSNCFFFRNWRRTLKERTAVVFMVMG
jgi:hypothetical protein